MNRFFLYNILIGFLLFVIPYFAQPLYPKEKLADLVSQANDSVKFQKLYEIGFSYRAEDPLFSFTCANELLSAASMAADSFFYARAYNLFGILYYRNQQFDDALVCHQRSLRIREALHNEAECAVSYTNLGNVYSDLERFTESENYHLKAMNVFARLNNKKQVLNCWCNLGVLKQASGNLPAARGNLEQALILAEQINDMQARAMCCNNLGYVAQLEEKWDEAMSYFMEAAKLNEQMELPVALARCFYNVGMVYQQTNKLEEAKMWFSRALNLADTSAAADVKRMTMSQLAETYFQLGNSSVAYQMLKKRDEIPEIQLDEVAGFYVNFPEIVDRRTESIRPDEVTFYFIIVFLIVALVITFIWGLTSRTKSHG